MMGQLCHSLMSTVFCEHDIIWLFVVVLCTNLNCVYVESQESFTIGPSSVITCKAAYLWEIIKKTFLTR